MTEAIFPDVIDNTMRADFTRCPHYFFRRHCQGLTTTEGPSIDLHFGACLAKGLEVARRDYFTNGHELDAIGHGLPAIIKAWGNYAFNPRTANQEHKTLENCLYALECYFDRWPLSRDYIQIHVHNSEPCIEFSASAPIDKEVLIHPTTGIPLVYAGRFDMIGDYKSPATFNTEAGVPFGLDDKSTSSNVRTHNWDAQWRLRGQFSGYVWLARTWGLNLKGFVVRGIQVLTSSVAFNEAITTRPPWMVDAWHAQLVKDVRRMLAYWANYKGYEDTKAFHQCLDSGCTAYGRPCEYMDLCTNEFPEDWTDSYQTRRWHPLERTA